MAYTKVATITRNFESIYVNPSTHKYRLYNFNPVSSSVTVGLNNFSVNANSYLDITSHLQYVVSESGSGSVAMYTNAGASEVDLERELINTAPTTPGEFTSPASGAILKGGETITVTHRASADVEGNAITYTVTAQYFNGSTWATLPVRTNVATTTGSYTLSTNKAYTKVKFTAVATDSNGATSGQRVSSEYQLVHNSPPSVTLNTTNNQTLYENNTFVIDGSAIDNDANQSVTVYYQINADAKRVLATNLSQVTIPFDKQLTFKGGKLYDGETAVSGTLVDGVAQTLKVWAQDSEGADSTPQTRTFYVVPNRAPSLTVDTVVPSGIIDADSFDISGTYTDLDGNTTTVSYRINGGNSVQIAQGTGGPWSFTLSLGQLVVGLNNIVVEAVDTYNAKTSKTIQLRKNEVKTPITRSTARYKVEPPGGTATEIMLWVQHDANLTVEASVSMTIQGEPESFVAMTKNTTAPLSQGNVEDEFYYDATEAKEAIVLQLDLTKSSADADETIKLITGVF